MGLMVAEILTAIGRMFPDRTPNRATNMAVKVGDIIRLTSEAVDNYGGRYGGVKLRVTHVARSVDEHPGYDSALDGEALVDTVVAGTGEEVPLSLYEYEFRRA